MDDLKHVLSLLQDERASSGPQRGLDDVTSLVAETRAAGVPVRLPL